VGRPFSPEGAVHGFFRGVEKTVGRPVRHVAFELVAVGKRSNFFRLDGKGSTKPTGIGFVLSLAPKGAPPVPPINFLGYGW